MFKIIYKAEPSYYTCGINEPATTELTKNFNNDSSVTEIIAQLIKVLEFMGYSKQTKAQWLNMIDDLVWDGYLINDSQDNKERE